MLSVEQWSFSWKIKASKFFLAAASACCCSSKSVSWTNWQKRGRLISEVVVVTKWMANNLPAQLGRLFATLYLLLTNAMNTTLKCQSLSASSFLSLSLYSHFISPHIFSHTTDKFQPDKWRVGLKWVRDNYCQWKNQETKARRNHLRRPPLVKQSSGITYYSKSPDKLPAESSPSFSLVHLFLLKCDLNAGNDSCRKGWTDKSSKVEPLRDGKRKEKRGRNPKRRK